MLVRAIIASSLGVMDGECSLAGDSSVLWYKWWLGTQDNVVVDGVSGRGRLAVSGCRALL